MKNSIISAYEQSKFSEVKKFPKFRPGDTIRVSYSIQEGSDKKKARVQRFEGVVIRYKRGGVESSFTVRKIGANGVGVERVFPVYSPHITKLDVLAHGVVRRSRLFYLRKLTGKAARIRSRYITKAKKTPNKPAES